MNDLTTFLAFALLTAVIYAILRCLSDMWQHFWFHHELERNRLEGERLLNKNEDL